MSISDTKQAKKYAAIAEVAAAQCKLLTEEASKAPEYTNQAKQYAESAAASSASAISASQQAVSSANGASQSAIAAQASAGEASASQQSAQDSENSASDSATSALNSANDAEASAASAAASVSNTLRISDGPVAPLPNAATRANKVLTCDASGNFQFTVPSSGSAADVLNELADSTGSSLVGTSSGKTVQQFIDVTGNVVGTNNYATLPAVGSTITSGSDYLYNGVLYTTVGESGTIQSITGNVVLTDNGNAYLLDKRWPVNDVRAWGVRDGVVADTEFTNAVTFITRNGGGIRTIYVPAIALYLNSVTISDLSTCSIHFDGTYIVGCATTSQQYVMRVFNAHTAAFTGVAFLEQLNNKYTYGLYLTAGLPSLIAPSTGIFHKFKIHDIRISGFPCCLKIGDGSDAQMSEIDIDIQTGKCNCGVEVAGSQAIASLRGQVLCEPQSGFSYEKACYKAIGSTIYHTGGEVVSTTDVDGSIASVTSVSSTLYSNPFGSVKITGAHIECAGQLMLVQQGSGISGSTDSQYSSVSFSNCQGSMMNGSKELIAQTVPDYEGTFSADANCNFYSSVTRSARLVYSLSPSFNFDVSCMAFRKGFNTLSSEIGSGNVNWIHGLIPIMNMSVNPVTVNANSQAPLGFSARASTGDYAFYYADTSSGGVVLVHQLSFMDVSISVPATSLLTIVVKVNGVESFSCQGSGSVTFTREMLPSGATVTFTAINGTGSSVTTASSARVIVSGANLK